jgi:RNA polymerase sigma factor (sigma-70 family)
LPGGVCALDALLGDDVRGWGADRMNMEKSRFDQLMRGIQEGSEDARRELIEIYGDHILRVVRRRLHQQMRRQYDSQDFEQAVWASFFGISGDQLTFRTPEELNRYLVTMTVNKLAEAFRQKMQMQRHDVQRERSLQALAGTRAEADKRQATPSKFVAADEFWQRILTACDKARDEQSRRVFVMLREGHTYDEIAAETGLHVKVIQRLVRDVKERVPQ